MSAMLPPKAWNVHVSSVLLQLSSLLTAHEPMRGRLVVSCRGASGGGVPKVLRELHVLDTVTPVKVLLVALAPQVAVPKSEVVAPVVVAQKVLRELEVLEAVVVHSALRECLSNPSSLSLSALY